MLSYLSVHLIYTFPVIGLLLFIARPLLSRGDILKFSLISSAAFIYSTLWHNYIVSNNLVTYTPEKVLASVGNAPVEEYMSLVVQTVLTLLWSFFFFRFSTPCLNFNTDKWSYQIIRWVPILVLSIITIVGYAMATTGESTLYLGSILYWACPAIIFMWYGAGNFFVKRIILSIIAIAVPTMYLCWVDQINKTDNGWRINEKTRLNKSVIKELSLEEAFTYFITNTLVVLAVSSYDKASGLMETYTLEFPHQISFSFKYMSQLFLAFLTAECSMPAVAVEDLKKCFDVLKSISKTMECGTLLFQGGIRLDFLIVYIFGRVTDEMFDNQTDPEKKKRDLQLCKDFVSELFADRKTPFQVKRKPEAPKIDWAKYESRLNDTELTSFRTMARISFYLPAQPFIELFDGYQWDIDGKLIETEEDLLKYSTMVAGSYGALSVYHIMYRDYNDKYYNLVESGKSDIIIKKAYQMGQGIQFVNMSRDIVTDSIPLGRCYIPVEYMDDKKNDVKVLRLDKNPRSLGETKLKKYADKLINLANKFQSESERTLSSLPVEVRGLLLAFTDMYRGYIPIIQSSPIYPTKARTSNWTQIKICIRSLYFRSLPYAI